MLPTAGKTKKILLSTPTAYQEMIPVYLRKKMEFRYLGSEQYVPHRIGLKKRSILKICSQLTLLLQDLIALHITSIILIL